MLPLIDTHAHIDAPKLAGSGPDLLPPALAAGIGKWVMPGVRVADWQTQLKLCRRNPQLYSAPGLHPAYAEQWSETAAEQLRELARQQQVVAVGEIGLDGVNGPALAQQEQVLRAQLQIALEEGLPVLLHGRKTTGKLLDILGELQVGQQVGGIWHGFSGSLQVARERVRLGFKIGVGPILLRASARKLPQAVADLPFDALVLETDFPDMAERPEILIAVAERVALLRGCSLAEVAQQTTDNASRLFGFKD